MGKIDNHILENILNQLRLVSEHLSKLTMLLQSSQSFIEKWQTLIGALLGGIFAVSVALIVAYKAKRQEETVAATLLIADLHSVKVAAEVLDKHISETKIPEKDMPIAVVTMLLRSRPTLSPLFESSMALVMAVDKYLAAHLYLFRICYSSAEDLLKRQANAVEIFYLTEKRILSKEEIIADLKAINSHFHDAVEHVPCCEQLLDKLILCRTALLHRLIRLIHIPASENDCRKLLGDLKLENNISRQGQKKH